MKQWILAVLFLAPLSLLIAATLRVALDGSQPYSNIQSAIEASDDGDTVLVYPGRYYENIDFTGKSITVCSLEATTNDSTYISGTVIDGSQSGSCVAMRTSEHNAALRGFTLTNGSGYTVYDEWHRGGGLLLFQVEQVSISNCIITGNKAGTGGGIYSFNCSMTFSGLRVYNNYSIIQGGGIVLHGASNYYPIIVFDPTNRCSVYSNYGISPVDIIVSDIRASLEINLDMFTVATPDRFYIHRNGNLPLFEEFVDTVDIQRAYRVEVNHDLYVSPAGLDSNSGLSPDEAMRSITRAVHRIAGDSLDVKTVHVLPGTYREGADDQILPVPMKSNVNITGAGSDRTMISSDTPCWTKTKYLLTGAQIESATLGGFRLISDGESKHRAIYLGIGTKDAHISDIVATDILTDENGGIILLEPESSTLDSIVFRNISTPEMAVFLYDSVSCTISNSVFENIHSTYTSPDTPGDDSWSWSVIGIFVKESLSINNCQFRNYSVQNNQFTFGISRNNNDFPVSVDVNNCLFENIRTNNVIPIAFHNNRFGEYRVSNCTFYDNYGAGAAVGIYGNVVMRNNIFCNPDAAYEIKIHNAITYSDMIGNLDFDYNNITGGIGGIYNPDPLNTLVYGDHNISTTPRFASTTPGDPEYLRLAESSPCVDTGTPDISGLNLLPCDLTGNLRVWNGRIDMGCFEYGSEPWVDNDDPELPAPPEGITLSLYPNPFLTTSRAGGVFIEFILPKKPISQPLIEIFNVRGQKVRSIQAGDIYGSLVRKAGLSDDLKGQGEFYSTVWNGKSDNSQPLASGTYIIRVSADAMAASKKITLLK
jgi:hypothetical protein